MKKKLTTVAVLSLVAACGLSVEPAEASFGEWFTSTAQSLFNKALDLGKQQVVKKACGQSELSSKSLRVAAGVCSMALASKITGKTRTCLSPGACFGTGDSANEEGWIAFYDTDVGRKWINSNKSAPFAADYLELMTDDPEDAGEEEAEAEKTAS